MFKLLKLVRLLRKVDGLAFKKRARIKLEFRGRPGYTIVTSEDGKITKNEYYSVSIFYRHGGREYDPVRIAIHEVRHRVQHTHPAMRLFTVGDDSFPEDFKEFLRTHVQPEILKKMTPREIDAEIFDELSYPVFSANDIKRFLKLLFQGT